MPEGWGYSISKLVELVELLPKSIFEADKDIWIRIKEIFHGTKFKVLKTDHPYLKKIFLNETKKYPTLFSGRPSPFAQDQKEVIYYGGAGEG